ncbi:unnamed protein product [Urochloa decumbens]|uniref:Uncharacterized protein n=1 Tax=Urochloa decumbens TaxID=240449 RepID=A0ABC9B2L8_9POAL
MELFWWSSAGTPTTVGIGQDVARVSEPGSTTEYLRANGPDIVLTVEDVLNGKYGSSSSSSDSSNSEPEVQSLPCPTFQMVEKIAFDMLTLGSIHQPRMSPPVLDRVSVNRTCFTIDRRWLEPNEQGRDDSLAIIPYRPTLPAVLLKIWTDAQPMASQIPNSSNVWMVETNEAMATGTDGVQSEVQSVAASTVLEQQDEEIIAASSCLTNSVVSLPEDISATNSATPLDVFELRRSNRFGQNKDSVQLLELEDNSRKKRRVWRKVQQKKPVAVKAIENLPNATEVAVQVPIPATLLQEWGVACSVAPEELTEEAVGAEPTPMVPNEGTTN